MLEVSTSRRRTTSR